MENNYILGAGVSGLICCFYNGGKVITDNIGGQFLEEDFILGPRFLEANEYSRKLLKDLKLPIKERVVKVGYFNGEFTNSDEGFRRKYFNQSRKIKSSKKLDETCLNGNKSEMEVFDVDFRKLVRKLYYYTKKNVFVAKIIDIDLEKKLIVIKERKSPFKFETLVNTIPLDVFQKISNFPKSIKLERKFVTFVKLEEEFFDTKDFDFVYFINKPYNRITKCRGYLVAECPGEISKKDLIKYFGKFYIKHKTMKTQIISKEIKHKYDDLILLGRYGAWDRKYKIEKVVEKSLETKKNKKEERV